MPVSVATSGDVGSILLTSIFVLFAILMALVYIHHMDDFPRMAYYEELEDKDNKVWIRQ